ncbi:MAG: DNA helicase RecQ [Caldilineaceae bacterium SB0662_bin_9]|uniref:DNA helicase RecQ n=1 Tax=Caldilineaceae bacterium SB0662_bin_9 TaxID=2605258 RepID=A0A6B1DUA3_9CHLR|nr:DNA helicase RecQ [Caldilineaceae bacterium SB0662_bin_9]
MQLDVCKPILEQVFGFQSLRPGQADIIEAILQRNHVLGVMPTGAGKSLCYQLPALVLDGLTLVVSPLVALMDDQVAALRLSGVAAETINGNRSRADNRAAWQRVSAGHAKLLYLAPERMMQPRMIASLQRLPVNLIAVDEAHCISKWGPAFRPDYVGLSQLGDLFPGVPIAAFTATADRATRDDICEKLFNRPARVFSQGFDRPNIHLAVQPRRNPRRVLLDFVNARQGQSGIVYCLSRNSTEKTAALLRSHGVDALPYHAGLDAAERLEHQQMFMSRSGMVMVATIAFGMGIDKADIRFVFHADLPASMEAYYQEIGRAGRDGLPADTMMLFGLTDIVQRRRFIDEPDADPEFRRQEHQRLNLLLGYCEGVGCRRQALLGAFDERLEEPCGNCDNCQNPPEEREGMVEGQKVLSAAHRTGQRFGASYLIDVLLGNSTTRIQEWGHDSLPTFGVGRDHNNDEWRSIVRQLVAGSFLSTDIGGHGGLSITPKGRRLLSGEENFSFRIDPQVVASRRRSGSGNEGKYDTLGDRGDKDLFEYLRTTRLALARTHNVPAFMIFSDRTLIEMAFRRPRTPAELKLIPGVGDAKLARFGEVFLSAIGRHVSDQGPSELSVEEESPGMVQESLHAGPQVASGRNRPGSGNEGKHDGLKDREERALFEHLRTTRLTLARADNVPAFRIFSDRTLIEMAIRKPRTPAELQLVPGVGDVKLARFGEVFLSAIGRHMSDQRQ